ncbi:MAG TPA: Crp/Fnr family transcriptional regulator [Chitinophagaceae bacterium]
MDSIGPLYRYLNKFVHLTTDEFDEIIKPRVIIRHFGKKEMISEDAVVENYFNFLLKGAARKFYKNGTGEVITQIAQEGQIIMVEDSFLSRRPSSYCVETIEPVSAASITYNDLEHIYSSNAKMERMGRLVVTTMMVLRERWQTQLIKLTPRERFIKFVHSHPALIQRVPQKHLASYLNIQPETFSRFKHLLKGSPRVQQERG